MIASVLACMAVPALAPRVRAQDPTVPQVAGTPAVETAAAGEGTGTPDAAAAEPETVINADEMSFDMDKGLSTYSGNVTINHATLTLSADVMEVKHGPDNQPEQIVARRNVRVADGEMHVSCDRAEYNLTSKQITLSGDPRMNQGPNSLSGADELIYRQDKGQFTTKGGRPRLLLHQDAKAAWLPKAAGADGDPAPPDAPADTPK